MQISHSLSLLARNFPYMLRGEFFAPFSTHFSIFPSSSSSLQSHLIPYKDSIPLIFSSTTRGFSSDMLPRAVLEKMGLFDLPDETIDQPLLKAQYRPVNFVGSRPSRYLRKSKREIFLV